MKFFNNILDKIDDLLNRLAIFALFVLMIMIFLDAFLRATLNSPFVGTVEITGEYLLGMIVYLSISNTLKQDGHVRVDILENKFPRNIRVFLRIFTNLLASIAFTLLGIHNFQRGIEFLEKDVRSVSTLEYPLAPALFIISLGVFLLSIRLIVESINQIKKNFGKEKVNS